MKRSGLETMFLQRGEASLLATALMRCNRLACLEDFDGWNLLGLGLAAVVGIGLALGVGVVDLGAAIGADDVSFGRS